MPLLLFAATADGDALIPFRAELERAFAVARNVPPGPLHEGPRSHAGSFVCTGRFAQVEGLPVADGEPLIDARQARGAPTVIFSVVGGSEMERVKHGVIGIGWFGEKHCEAIDSIPNMELYALCTRTESRLEEVAERFGVEHIYTDYNEMLQNPELESVSITTMWDQHVDPALAALDAGKHVFCEKPMASTVEDCQRMVDAANAADNYFMVGHICRFNPRYRMARNKAQEGICGEIVSMWARRNIPGWVTTGILPKIGPIVGDGVHDMDIMMWASGLKPVKVYAKTVNVRDLGNPDLGWSMFTMDNGAIAVLENIWFLPEKTAMQIDERMEIIGTEGSIHVQETAPNFAFTDSEGYHHQDATYWMTIEGRLVGALPDELRYFADCIQQEQRPTIITPEESMATVKACLAARESADTGKEVEIEW